jgi:hypothetical protein
LLRYHLRGGLAGTLYFVGVQLLIVACYHAGFMW